MALARSTRLTKLTNLQLGRTGVSDDGVRLLAEAPFAGGLSDLSLFGNTIATLEINDRDAEVFFEQPRRTTTLEEAGRVSLNRGAG